MNNEYLDQLEEEIRKENEFLLSHRWVQLENGDWTDPDGNTHQGLDAFSRLTSKILKENGWKSVIEIHHTTCLHGVDHVEKRARFQSPVTGNLYTFIDAQATMLNSWTEDLTLCCKSSRRLTELIGKDFSCDHVETWFGRKPGEIKANLYLFENKNG